MPQGAVTSVTLRSEEFNEGDENSSSLRLTAEKGFGRQRRGHYSRHLVQCGSSLSKRSLHKEEARICLSKKSKVTYCTKGRDDEKAVGHKAQRGVICSSGTRALSLLSIFLLASYNSIIEH